LNIPRLVVFVGLVAVAASCAFVRSEAESAGAREALKRHLAADADSYALVTIEDLPGGGRATKGARFERTLAKSDGPVTRTQIAVCTRDATSWRCDGPMDGVRIAFRGSVQRLVVPVDLEDAAIVAIVDFVGSACFDRQVTGTLRGRQISAIERHGNGYFVGMGDRAGIDILTLETTADPGSKCAFEIRQIRPLN